ncbi:MAG: terminase large subunit [Acidimicrobiia bacterium]
MARKPRSASSRKPAPPICGFTFDRWRCRARGEHLCRPRALKAKAFFTEILVHTKGRWARKPFLLARWQWLEIVRPVFGTVWFEPELGRYVRRHRIVWIELARKNGKSELLAGIALYLLMGDDEESAEIYGCAKDRPQARKVWDVAHRMVKLSPTLSSLWRSGEIKVNLQEKRLIYEPTGSYYEIITADALGELGHNPHGVVFDEVLTQPDDGMWNALRTAMGAREQPLMAAATTAGNDPESFAGKEHDYSLRVARDPDLDPARFVFARNTPPKAAPFKERNWRHANPALGDFLSIQALRDEAREASNNPRKENAFRQFRLNQWVRQTTRWVALELWDATASIVVEGKLAGRRCYAGLRVAAVTDVAAWVLDFPDEAGGHDALFRFFVPEAKVGDLDQRTEGEASVWVRQGFLEVTPGDALDYEAIVSQIYLDAAAFSLEEIALDRLGATQLAQELDDEGFTVATFGQGYRAFGPPLKEWERLIREGEYRHGGNPPMRWMFDGIAVRSDPEGNFKFDLPRSRDTVVGPLAATMALDRVLRSDDSGDLGAILVG